MSDSDRYITEKPTTHKSFIYGSPCIACRQFCLLEILLSRSRYCSPNLGEGSYEFCKFQEAWDLWVVYLLKLNYKPLSRVWRKLLHNLFNGILMSGRSPTLKSMCLYHPPSICTRVSSDLGNFHEPIHSNIFHKTEILSAMVCDRSSPFTYCILIVLLDHSFFPTTTLPTFPMPLMNTLLLVFILINCWFWYCM